MQFSISHSGKVLTKLTLRLCYCLYNTKVIDCRAISHVALQKQDGYKGKSLN